jgi:2-dehydropantoate 2-reductase
MSFQKIIVLGAGAIGSSYGALLSRKNDVTLIGNKAHVDAIESNGLLVEGDVEGRFPVKAAVGVRELPPGSLILLTTKAQDMAEAINEVKALLKKDTVIVVLQNGLKIRELIQESVGTKIEVVRGLVLLAAEFLEPGKIKLWNGPTIIARTKTGEKIASLLRESGIQVTVAEDMEKEEWSKLIVNCVINPLTAVLRVRNNEIGADSLRVIRRKIVEECVRVGNAEGIRFKSGLQADLDRRIGGYSNFSSMCQDIVKGKKTEIEFLNGKIVELGKKHGISTPVNETLVGLIRFMEAKM